MARLGEPFAHDAYLAELTALRDQLRDGFLQTLHHVPAAYPTARLSADDRGLTLSHSPPPVAPRHQPKLL
jgi:hypothetical protein